MCKQTSFLLQAICDGDRADLAQLKTWALRSKPALRIFASGFGLAHMGI